MIKRNPFFRVPNKKVKVKKQRPKPDLCGAQALIQACRLARGVKY